MSLSISNLSDLASDAPVRHTIAIDSRPLTSGALDWPTHLPQPERWTLTMDETRRPMVTGSITWPRSAINTATIDPTGGARPRLRITAGYHWPTLNKAAADQLAVVVATSLDIDYTDDTVTLEVASDEVLLDEDLVPPGAHYTMPAETTTLAQVWTQARAACRPLHALTLTSDTRIDPPSNPALRALKLDPGSSYLDFLWAAAEATDQWLHSNQAPDSQGGLVAEPRAEPAWWDAVDLSTNAWRDVVTRRSVRRDLSDAASHLDLTATWTENGEPKSTARRYAASGVAFTQVVQRTIEACPPGSDGSRTLPADYPIALNILDRLKRRTWTAVIEARSLYWLRPRSTIRTDDGLALITSITHESSTGLMTLTARPY